MFVFYVTAMTLGAAPPCVPRACEIYDGDDDGDYVASTRLCAGFSP